jgi:hypothetical protein
MVTLRNKFNYTPVIIQQQSTETADLEAFKANKIRPTTAGLSDSKYTARDCNTMLGIVNPFKFEIPTYLKYNIERFQDNTRRCAMKGYVTDSGYMGYVDGRYVLFASESDYVEYSRN